uniref:Mur ligase domain-containing protein n=1 Tax=Dialister succinatiphilus TaxID=487173 RepID=UPI003FF0E0B2
MNLKEYTNFHFIGIGGMGMRALAEILLEKGYSVTVSVMDDSQLLEIFRKRRASIFIGHDASHVK